MCRLMLFNTSWLQLVEENELKGLFKTLDDKNGGHGIGIAFCYDKTDPVIHKGVNLDPYELAALVYGEKDNPDLKYVIYHARMASAAHVTDKLCHPFSEETLLGLTMAHNGHVRQFAHSSSYSDTAIMFNLITQYGLPLDFLYDQSGVFVGVYRKMPFVIKATSYGDLDLAYTPDYDAFCFASSFYHYSDKFRHRFIIEKRLGSFSWSKRLTAKEVNKMYTKYSDYDWNSYSPKGTHTVVTTKPAYPGTAKKNDVLKSIYTGKGDYIETDKLQPNTYVEGYGYIKTRNMGGTVTYHAQDCNDWYYCQGDCLTVVE